MAKKVRKALQVDTAGTTAIIEDEAFKDYLHEQIARLVKAKTGVAIRLEGGRQVFNLITELVFKRVVETGYFRFPSGYGSLKLVKLKEDAAPRTMPGGEIVTPKQYRYKVKYKDGVAVMDMLGTNPHKYVRKSKRPSVADSAELTV